MNDVNDAHLLKLNNILRLL